MEIDDDGAIPDTKSSASSEMGWRPFLKAMIESGCIKRGAHVGRNKKTREQFLMDVVSFFSETLK